MLTVATMNAATFMGMNFLDNENSIINTTDLTLKKIFDISEKLVSEQEEIDHVDNMDKVMKPFSVFNAQKSTSSQILCCVLEGSINIRNRTNLGRTR